MGDNYLPLCDNCLFPIDASTPNNLCEQCMKNGFKCCGMCDFISKDNIITCDECSADQCIICCDEIMKDCFACTLIQTNKFETRLFNCGWERKYKVESELLEICQNNWNRLAKESNVEISFIPSSLETKIPSFALIDLSSPFFHSNFLFSKDNVSTLKVLKIFGTAIKTIEYTWFLAYHKALFYLLKGRREVYRSKYSDHIGKAEFIISDNLSEIINTVTCDEKALFFSA